MEFNPLKLRKNLESTTASKQVTVICYEINKIPDILKQMNATGEVSEIFCFEDRIYIGVGEIDPEKRSVDFKHFVGIYRAMATLSKKLTSNYRNYCVTFQLNGYLQECYYGFILSSYKYYDPKENGPLFYLNYDIKEFKEIVEIAHAQNIARYFSDTPANLLTPSLFVEYATALLKDYKNVEIKVLNEQECKDLGMGLFCSVSQGSVQEGKLLTLKFFNKNKSDHDIALVGKGVTFDSGGISLKPAKDMHLQKMDMTGGATMLATFLLAVKLNLNINLTCTIPLVENMPSEKATKPGDVFTAMNGKTVEINNTDAEGRLILADAMTYAQRMYSPELPKYLIDTCTLTGAIKVALGDIYAGFFSNSDVFANLISLAANDSNEFLHRMPLSVYYLKKMKSDVADHINTEKCGGGACTACAFLNEFVEKGVKHAHFDIAGVKIGFPTEVFGNGATGRSVPAFFNILKKIAK